MKQSIGLAIVVFALGAFAADNATAQGMSWQVFAKPDKTLLACLSSELDKRQLKALSSGERPKNKKLRRAAGREAAGFGLILGMAALNLPSLAQKVLPVATLFGAILTFSRLTRSHELIVARAAGVSVWQFLAPALVIALLLGTFMVTLFNPLAAIMSSRYEQLEGRFLEGRQRKRPSSCS